MASLSAYGRGRNPSEIFNVTGAALFTRTPVT
jgi:hypothetical protein